MGKGEKSLLCDPGSELRLGGREKKEGQDSKWDGKNEEKKGKKDDLSDLSEAWNLSIDRKIIIVPRRVVRASFE